MPKGLYTNKEIVDTLINDLNNTIKQLVSGQYLQACCIVTQMSQKLVNLRTSIDDDLRSRDQHIEELKNELRAAGREVLEVPEDELINNKKDGAE
jgi:hypothetical protein